MALRQWHFQIYHTTYKHACDVRLINKALVHDEEWERGSKNESGKRLISEETASLPSGTEVESRCQMFSLFEFPVIFLSLPTWSLIFLRLRVPGVTSQYFPPCYLLVWPPCVKLLSAHAQFALPPSLSELFSYISQTFIQSPCVSKSLLFFCSIERNTTTVSCSSHS